MVEQEAVNFKVGGSNPPGGAKSLRSLETASQVMEFHILCSESSPGSKIVLI